MAISIGVANPGRISSVGVANPGRISSPAGSSGAYWIGQDGKVYVKGAQGTNAAGNYDQNSDTYWSTRGFSKINDPNQSLPTPRQPSIYGGGGGAPTVYAPRLDIAALGAQARAGAESAVNPYYTLQLNQFLAKQAAQKQQQQTQYETNVKNAEEQLKQTLEGNEITKQRTTEDVAQNQQQIAQTADEFQTDTGQQFAEDRLALAKEASTGGLGQQKVEKVQTARNLQETRQTGKFEQQKQEQELFKGRTFEDLTRSGEIATKGTTRAKEAAKFDLDSYIQNMGFQESEERDRLRTNQLQEIAAKEAEQRRLLFNNYLNNISNPAQRQAAVSQYGGQF